MVIKDEKLEDTLLDLINYSIILLSYYTYSNDSVDTLDESRKNDD